MSTLPGEPTWLTVEHIKLLHAESIRLFGGLDGVRDENLLHSALARPQHLHAYGGGVSIFALAAAYGHGIAKNHAFLDGNKRTALLSIRAFLFRNGYTFKPDQLETVTTIEGLAAGQVSQEQLAEWIEANASPRA